MHLIIGVGGPTSSGKTTLVKHLARILSSGSSSQPPPLIVHQDDFAPLEESLPWNKDLQARDWDHPHGAIDYPRLVSTFQHIRSHSSMPSSFSSHDQTNLQPNLPISSSIETKWTQTFHKFLNSKEAKEMNLELVLADGFLLYYNSKVRSQIDVRLLLRISKGLLKERRENRGGYNTGEGVLWTDPPHYFEKALWPGYTLAHSSMFENEDVENGKPIQSDRSQKLNKESLSQIEREKEGLDGGIVNGLVVLEAELEEMKPRKMDDLVEEACSEIERNLKELLEI